MKALFGKKPEYRARALRWADKQQVMVTGRKYKLTWGDNSQNKQGPPATLDQLHRQGPRDRSARPEILGSANWHVRSDDQGPGRRGELQTEGQTEEATTLNSTDTAPSPQANSQHVTTKGKFRIMNNTINTLAWEAILALNPHIPIKLDVLINTRVH